MSLPSPYIVNLIGPSSEPRESSNSDSAQPDAGTALVDKEAEKNLKDSKLDLKRKDDMIEAIKAKKEIAKRHDLKTRMNEIKGGETKPVTTRVLSGKGTGSSKAAGGTGSYNRKGQSEIERYWDWPETAEKNLEMKIAVKIMKDGSIVPVEVIKRSGNSFFDRLVINAIRKASPVTPPPYELIGKATEIEADLRFYR
jgi:TonB family protein